jgi:hypothetical protein
LTTRILGGDAKEEGENDILSLLTVKELDFKVNNKNFDLESELAFDRDEQAQAFIDKFNGLYMPGALLTMTCMPTALFCK